ncbi:MAG: ATP-binding protein [Pelovirga sp.]
MQHTRHSLTRLPLWTLLLLAGILGGGSFFWQATLRNDVIDQLDSQLLLLAQVLENWPQPASEDAGGPPGPCRIFRQLPEVAAQRVTLAVYSASGTLLCSPDQPGKEDRQAVFTQDIEPVASATFSIATQQQQNYRVLLYPLWNDGQLSHHLVLGTSLEPLERRLNRLRLGLFLVAITLLAGAAYLSRRTCRTEQQSMVALAQLMERTRPDRPPEPVASLPADNPGLQRLAASYQRMRERFHADLNKTRQFTADVTHELRTPLTILRGETEIALRGQPTGAEMRRVLESNLEEIKRMSCLIEDLLLLSKSDRGEIKLQRAPVHLEALLGELRHQAQVLARKKELSVELDCPAGRQTILHADELRLRQVFLNLLTNAIRYSQPRGSISITLTPGDKQVAVTVSDTGIGMEEQHLDRIFERFYRVDRGAQVQDGGSGLGLAIVKWIVEAHQGRVQVSSTPGKGSSFTVVLPCPGTAERETEKKSA